MILVGNKCDLPDAAVTREMGQSLADKYKIEYIETSSEDNLATTEAFDILCEQIWTISLAKIKSNFLS